VNHKVYLKEGGQDRESKTLHLASGCGRGDPQTTQATTLWTRA